MTIKTNIYITVCASIIGILLSFKYGRSLWHPIYTKVVGKKTQSDIYNEVGKASEIKLRSYFNAVDIHYPPQEITLIALKEQRVLEVWSSHEDKNTLIHIYNFTGYSGQLGPKLKSGDMQIPEGIYRLEYLNPNSSYHLSMKIDYPNKFDVTVAQEEGRNNLGGDIFIHGKSNSIGCIPIGDANIEELFTLVYRTGLENVKVIIAPNDLRINRPKYQNSNLKWLGEKYKRVEDALNKFTETKKRS
jgi:murein L,D-transpeptidase YafK